MSPITLIIVNHFFGKLVKNKKWHKSQMELVRSGFEITDLKTGFIASSISSCFTDMEDGLQYECALSAKAKLIITRDISDFFPSKIPVVHPQDFVNRYLYRP